MTARLAPILGLDRASLIHGLRLAFAATIAFAIAASFHVQNAYWAAMPVFVVAQPTRGLILERGLFRILGTLAGAGLGLVLLQLAGQPLAMLALLGVWVGLNAALTQVLRGVHGHAPLLAGMTAAVVVLSSVFSPEHGVALARARVECTLIGVVVATLVIGLTTRESPREAFYRQIRDDAADALRAAILTLRGEAAASAESDVLQRLAKLQERAGFVAAGSIDGYRRLHRLHALVVAALGVMSHARTLRRRKAEPPF